jgi:hypothetical protein
MEDKKQIKFILPSDWFLKDPIDFEHKEYVLNSFLMKVEDALSRGEIYPFFTEISLHMASIGSFLKSNKYVFINKYLNIPKKNYFNILQSVKVYGNCLTNQHQLN